MQAFLQILVLHKKYAREREKINKTKLVHKKFGNTKFKIN